MCNQVNMDVPVYFIKNQWGQRQTLHWNWLFLIKRVDPKADPQVAVRLFNVASIQIGSEVLHWEMSKASTQPLYRHTEIQAQTAYPLNIDAQDIQESKLWELITCAYKALQAIHAGWCLNEEWGHKVFCCWNAIKIHFGRHKMGLESAQMSNCCKPLGQLLRNLIVV